MDINSVKIKVQRTIVIFSIALLVAKFGAYYLTDSVGILTDAMESIVNVAAGLISLFALKMAAAPRDSKHPFGHGKVEFISASLEGILIIAAGGIIIWEAFKRIFTPEMPEKLDIGIIVVAAAGLINYILGWWSIRQGKKHNSIALISGGRHLQSDTYSTIGLVFGLILLYVTEIPWIDSALAFIFGGIIIWTGISILRKTLENLMDQADFSLLEQVLKVINDDRHPDWIEIHNLKVIRYGSYYYIDCDLTMPWYYNVRQGHDTCDALRDAILAKFALEATISIHSDSCVESQCPDCAVMDCKFRKAAFIRQNQLTLDELTQTDEARNKRYL